MLDAVIFDLGNTLFTATAEGYRDEAWEQRLGLEPGTFGRKIWNSEMERAALVGAVQFPEFWAWVGRTLRLNDRQSAELDEGLWRGVVLLPEVTSWLGRLRGTTLRIAALSNAWSDARGHTEGRYGIEQFLEFIAYSAEIGFAKPDPRAFTAVADRLGVPPERMLLVDDSPANIEAAAALGMATVRCVRPDQMMRDVDTALGLR